MKLRSKLNGLVYEPASEEVASQMLACGNFEAVEEKKTRKKAEEKDEKE